MALFVQKFGGTSVRDISCMRRVADIVESTRAAGHQVVVVLSAMAGETDRLEQLAMSAADEPSAREMDVLLSTGEQVSVALLSMLLDGRGTAVKSFLGGQLQIQTDNQHMKARILHIDNERLRQSLDKNEIPVVAGFQGINERGDITTLGRGGSDTTAVGLAVALQADECQIYTDVEGVYTADPRLVSNARRMPKVTFEEMLELASLGAKVLQIRAVEFAGKYDMPLRVLSTFQPGEGTLITYEDEVMEKPLVSGVAYNRDEAKVILRGVPDTPGVAGLILGPVSRAGIEVDMIIQNFADDGTTDFSFTVHRRDFAKAKSMLTEICSQLGAKKVIADEKIAKVSLVGVGMRSHAGIASKMFDILGREAINIQMIATSEIKVSVVMDEKYLELAVRALHNGFGLEEPPVEEKAA